MRHGHAEICPSYANSLGDALSRTRPGKPSRGVVIAPRVLSGASSPILLLLCCLTALGGILAAPAPARAEKVMVVPYSQQRPDLPHQAHGGAVITLKAVVRDAESDNGYIVHWDTNLNGNYDDEPGTSFSRNTTTHTVDIGRTFTVPTVSHDTLLSIGVRVRNAATSEITYASFPLYIHTWSPSNDPTQWTDQQVAVMSDMAVQEALWFLHRTSSNFSGYNSNTITATPGFAEDTPQALMLFATNGRLPAYPPGSINAYGTELPAGWTEANDLRWNADPYAETVARFLNYSTSSTATVTISAGNEDTTCGYAGQSVQNCPRIAGSTDLRGIASHLGISSTVAATGAATAAFSLALPAVAGTPVQYGPHAGTSWPLLVQQMVDYLGYAQIDSGAGSGGWNWNPLEGSYAKSSAITSEAAWVLMGLNQAELSGGAYGVIVNNKHKYKTIYNLMMSQNADGGVSRNECGATSSSLEFTGAALLGLRWVNAQAMSGTGIPYPNENALTQDQIRTVYNNYVAYTGTNYAAVNKRDDCGWLDGLWQNGDYLCGSSSGIYDQAKCGNSYGLFWHALGSTTASPELTSVGGHAQLREFSIYFLRAQTRSASSSYSLYGRIIDEYCTNPSYTCVYGSPYYSTTLAAMVLTQAQKTYLAPVAEVSPATAHPGETIAFSHGKSFIRSGASSIAAYQWDADAANGLWWDDPGAYGFVTDSATTPFTHAYASPGTYTATLRIVDNGNPARSKTVPVTVTVEAASRPLARAGGPYVVEQGHPLVLSGTGSLAGSDPLVMYVWDTDKDGLFGTDDTAVPAGPNGGTDDYTGATVTISWTGVGTWGRVGTIHPIALKVRDVMGVVSDPDYTTVSIVEDTTPPAVQSTSPANGATTATLAGNVSIVFTEAINCTTVLDTTVFIAGVPATLSCSGATVTINPLADLNHDTTYSVTITPGVLDASDMQNPMAAPYSFSFTTIPPTASLSGAPATPTNQTTAGIDVSGAGLTHYKYSLDGVNWSEEYAVGTPLSLSGLTEGTVTVYVIGRGPAGHYQATPTTVSFTVDLTPPTETTFSGQPALMTNATGTDIAIGGAGVSHYRYSLDGGEWTAPIEAATHLRLSDLIDGSHTLSLQVRDAAGNWQTTTTTYAWIVDTVRPTAHVTAAPPTPTNQTALTVNVVSDEDATHYKYDLDGAGYGPETPVGTAINLADLEDGTHALSIIGKDGAGNWQAEEDATTLIFVVDTVSPVATVGPTPPSVTSAFSIDLVVGGEGVTAYRHKLDDGDYGGENPVATHIMIPVLSDGQHHILVIGRDAAGNWQSEDTPTVVSWTVDTVSPIALVTGTPASPTNHKTATLTIGGQGVTHYRFSRDSGLTYSETEIPIDTDIALTDLADGGHSVWVVGRDAAGNWQPLATPTKVAWVVDTDSPQAGLSGLPSSPTNQTTAEVTVMGEGVTSYQYQFDGGGYGAFFDIDANPTISLSFPTEGPHALAVKGRDAAGNVQDTPTTGVWTVDLSAPAAVLYGAPSGTVGSNDATIGVSGEGVAAYRFKRDDEPDYGPERDLATMITLTGLGNGSHTVYVIARDAAGNWQSSPTTATWIVDTIAPSAELTGAPTGTVNTTLAAITVGGDGVAAYRYKLDEGEWSAERAVSEQILLSGLSEGSHTLYVVVGDAIGNWQPLVAPPSYTWTIDLTAPAAPTIPAGPNPATRSTAKPVLSWSAVASAASYVLQISDTADFSTLHLSRTVAGTSHSLTAEEALPRSGRWHWRVRAVDAAGNQGEWVAASFSFAAGAPAASGLLLLR